MDPSPETNLATTIKRGTDPPCRGKRPRSRLPAEPQAAGSLWVLGVPGHSSAVITLRTYAHLFPGDEDRTRDVLDAALSPLADCVRTEAASDA